MTKVVITIHMIQCTFAHFVFPSKINPNKTMFIINQVDEILCLPLIHLISVILDMIFTIKALTNFHFLSSCGNLTQKFPQMMNLARKLMCVHANMKYYIDRNS